GFSSQASVNAVRLAARGMTGIRSLLEGEAGVFKVYFKGEYDREKMVANLGKEFLSGGMTYKYWPAVGNAHTYIHAAIELMKENNIDLDQVAAVKVYVGDFQQRMCSPLAERQVPNTLVDAKFSLPFLVALALVKGQMDVGDFTSEALKDQTVLALARKVVPVPDSSYNWTSKLPDGKIEVLLADGTSISRLGSRVPGSVELPMTWDELFHKFGSCARAAVSPLSADRIVELCNSLKALESIRDVREIVAAAVSNIDVAHRKSA
ncbi:MmgE/PrpD family protein, partial [Rhizobium ruizarguesonis]